MHCSPHCCLTPCDHESARPQRSPPPPPTQSPHVISFIYPNQTPQKQGKSRFDALIRTLRMIRTNHHGRSWFKSIIRNNWLQTRRHLLVLCDQIKSRKRKYINISTKIETNSHGESQVTTLKNQIMRSNSPYHTYDSLGVKWNYQGLGVTSQRIFLYE